MRLLVADDHPMIRQGIAGLIGNAVKDLTLLEASHGQEALEQVRAHTPDVMIIDMALPDMSGLDLIEKIRHEGVAEPIIAFSMYGEETYAERALRAGATGYVMKEEARGVLLEALERVLAGEIHLSTAMARKIAGRLTARSAEPSVPELLTARELEVWKHLGTGHSTRRISELLEISPKTVETHCHNIRQKTGLRNMTELVHTATRWLHGGGFRPH